MQPERSAQPTDGLAGYERFLAARQARAAKQLMLDFFGLGAILALWMITDAMSAGTWFAAISCIAAMPIFGSMSAALYWLLRAL